MEDLLAERGIAVDHVTVYRWVQRIVHHGGAGTTVAARAGVPQVAMFSDQFYWASRIRNFGNVDGDRNTGRRSADRSSAKALQPAIAAQTRTAAE